MQQKIVNNITIEYVPLEKGIEFRGLFVYGDHVARTTFEMIAVVAILQSFTANRLRDGEEYTVGEAVFQFRNEDIKKLRMQCNETVVHLDKVACQVITKICEKIVAKSSLNEVSHVKSFRNLLEVGHGY